ncbi:DUF2306 domain-containing protein [Roseibium polysiphoniae]|uniref:DUF2306 domain-containing protein n=1 Tax=Roseibium polysiphoniae TaxID=2571221 RepID=A0A944GSM3_9HYPH|nr:DUF2306 domain-containing protein [Roseibium polysiphoniae]MBS8259776.1 DUF2306 domain-containing protein [Roseibium polysiphoniae]
MTIAPLLDAGWLVASHALAALTAFVLGAVQLAAPKGTLPHRTLGYVWVILMLWIAGSSFFIYEIRLWGPFSPIHILSLLALFGLISGVLEARRKDIREHRKTMILLYSGALLIAGFFALMPGRTMHTVLFGS